LAPAVSGEGLCFASTNQRKMMPGELLRDAKIASFYNMALSEREMNERRSPARMRSPARQLASPPRCRRRHRGVGKTAPAEPPPQEQAPQAMMAPSAEVKGGTLRQPVVPRKNAFVRPSVPSAVPSCCMRKTNHDAARSSVAVSVLEPPASSIAQRRL